MKQMKTIKRIFCFIAILVLLSTALPVFYVQAAPDDNPVVVVLDAGHGGKSNGNEYFDLKEKNLDLTVTKAIKKYLETFEGVKVYLTRKDDVDSNVAVRCNYAKAKKADYFISIHFNASDEHMQAGSMIYVSANKNLSDKIMPLAQSVSESLEDLGIFANGIYSVVDEEGHDYKGLLRKCEEQKLSGMIIEHLYMDREEYLPLIDSKEALDAIGKADALAIAKALKLNSNSSIYHFQDAADIEYDEPYALEMNYMYPDKAEIRVESYEQITNRSAMVTFSITASDPQGALATYKISADGGVSFGEEREFKSAGKSEFSRIMRKGDGQTIAVDALNKYHMGTISNVIDVWEEIELDPEFSKKAEEERIRQEEEEAKRAEEEALAEQAENPDDREETKSTATVFDHEPKFNETQNVVVIFGAIAGLVIAILMYFIYKIENKPREKKEDGISQD